MDHHTAKAILEIISIMRAHIANCTLIEQDSVRSRNLVRLSSLEAQVHDNIGAGNLRPERC